MSIYVCVCVNVCVYVCVYVCMCMCETDSKVVGVRCVALVLVTICNEWNEFNGIALNYIDSGSRTPWTTPLEVRSRPAVDK